MSKTEQSKASNTGGEKRLSLWDGLLQFAGLLVTGLLLWWMEGGYPPPAWGHLLRLLHGPALSQMQSLLILTQAGCLLAAWGLLLMLTLCLMVHCLRKGFAPSAQQTPSSQHIPDLTQQADAKAQGMPTQHPHLDAMSTLKLAREQTPSKALPKEQDEDEDLLQQGQEEDFPNPFPPWSTPSVIFGQALQVTVASCSDEGMQRVPTTTSYLLTDRSAKDGTAHSLPISMVALADHLPADEPGYTASGRAIETMKELILHACMVMRFVNEEALAALFAEQVQKVIRVIGQQNQDDEALPAMAAVLIIGSTMFVEKMGETRVYLCHAQEGFSQLTQALPVLRPLKAGTSTVSGSQAQQTRGKRHDRGSGSPLAFQDDRKVVTLLAGDQILLCSDGVWSVLHASYLEHIIRAAGPDPADMCAALLQATRKSGSTDPVSIIAIHCQEAKASLP